MHYDSVIISDLHLGAKNCEAKRLRKFLHHLKKRKKISTDLLIIAGDGFDNLDPDRLKKKHHKVIKMLRNLSKCITVIWLTGNHDPDRAFIYKFIKVEVKDDFIVHSGDKKIFVSHGHAHDKFLSKHPLITNIADAIYNFSQFIDPTHSIAKTLKRKSKAFLKCAKKIGLGSALVAKEKGCDIACHGHNHHAGLIMHDGMEVWDSGCWTEKPGTYLTILDGKVELHKYKK